MSVVTEAVEVEPARWPTGALADALVDRARAMASAECEWLGLLAEFDRREGWRADGQLSGVDWLVWRCGMSRVTAREKLRVAHELRRRQAVRDAFSRGELSWCQVRAITRIEGADAETDLTLMAAAREHTVANLERLVRHWQLLADQERGVEDYLARYDRRNLRASRTFEGMMVVEVVLPIEEGEELLAHLRGVADRPVDRDSRESTGHRRVDALMDLARAGRANLDTPTDTSGADRYTVHVVAELEALAGAAGRAELLDGSPISVETLRRLSCDCALVRHVLKGKSEPLDLGRRTSVWSAAQRRAIIVRDGGKCRFPGCELRTCDIHHLEHYGDGGRTETGNGILGCPRHHTLLHEGGFRTIGDANDLMFLRPDGTPL